MSNKIINSFMLCMTLLLSMSCTSDDSDIYVPSDDKSDTYTCFMYLNSEALSGYSTTRSGDGKNWRDGDVIYVQFTYSGTSTTEYVTGNAVYQSDMDIWKLTYSRPIPNEGICEMYFFDPSTGVSSTVSIDEKTIVYEDLKASYKKNSKGDIVVHAVLAPKTGRVRFKGESNTTIYVDGLTFLSDYDVQKNEFTSASKALSLVVNTDGYTPYLYATSDAKEVNVELDYIRYTKTFGNILNSGQSGSINIPYPWEHAGWTLSPLFETFTVHGITFKMMYVGSGTFLMGATEEQMNPAGDEIPVHQVTLTNTYYMGETVVTQALWKAVMENDLSSSVGDNKAATNISWADCQNFITRLNELTGKNFRLPTEAEWEYAAREGYKASGHQYSGGSNIDDYAWYSVDFLPDVKTKKPNALGLYDMSGNVWEWCYDGYGKYSSANVTNPVVQENMSREHVLRGGCYQSAAEYCRTSTRYANYIPHSTFGFRLAF